jgi:ABC-type amino acid transport substrate-binding protein
VRLRRGESERPDELEGFDVEIASLLARGLGAATGFVLVDFRQLDQSVARGMPRSD